MTNAIESKFESPLTTTELAELAKYHEESIRRLIRAGKIKAVRWGRCYRIPASEVHRLLSEGLPTQ